MVAYTALAVHDRVRKGQKIDAAVFKTMEKEKIIGITRIIFMIFGYVLHLII